MTRLRALAAGYDRRSVIALVSLATLYVGVAAGWNHLIDLSRGMDWLLAGIWLFMTATLCWGIEVRRDLLIVAVGFGGGLVIEAWGTQTELWRYFTAERPPIWILPAWPVAALTIDRLARALERVVPERAPTTAAYWLMVPAFVVVMARFVWPSVHLSWTQVVLVLMVGVTATGQTRRRDALLMVAGAGLGIFLEYWGTSRRCWIYYTGEIPPVEAVLAHGFAAIAFHRAAGVLDAAWEAVAPRVGASRPERV